MLSTAICLGLAWPLLSSSDRLEAGPLRLDVHLARTAHLFHVVDQISAWSPFCHDQYLAAFPHLDDGDRAALAEHRDVRARRGWGAGLEQTFYTDAPLEDALAHGLEKGWIDERDAETEARVLEHFADRIEALIDVELERLMAFEDRIREGLPSLKKLAVRLERLVGETPAAVPVFLLANPSDRSHGGGYNGGRLTLEVPRKADPYGTFLHEVTHAFLDLRSAELEERVRGVDPRLDTQTLNEGITHAVSPGVIHVLGEGRDPLAERVRDTRAREETLDDYTYRVHCYALALRPLTREMLSDEELAFEAFLERAVDAWKSVAELELARASPPR